MRKAAQPSRSAAVFIVRGQQARHSQEARTTSHELKPPPATPEAAATTNRDRHDPRTGAAANSIPTVGRGSSSAASSSSFPTVSTWQPGPSGPSPSPAGPAGPSGSFALLVLLTSPLLRSSGVLERLDLLVLLEASGPSVRRAVVPPVPATTTSTISVKVVPAHQISVTIDGVPTTITIPGLPKPAPMPRLDGDDRAVERLRCAGRSPTTRGKSQTVKVARSQDNTSNLHDVRHRDPVGHDSEAAFACGSADRTAWRSRVAWSSASRRSCSAGPRRR